MAKTIKFNLNCNDVAVRTLDGLRENFLVDDVWRYYENGLLTRWLSVRGYEEELRNVEAITEKDAGSVIRELAKIFKVGDGTKDIEYAIRGLEYARKREAELKLLEEKQFRMEEVIGTYHRGYKELVCSMTENKEDMSRMKAAISEMRKNYWELFKLDYRELFYKLLDEAPKAIFALLMEPCIRKYYLPAEEESSTDSDKEAMYEEIQELLKDTRKLLEILGADLRRYSGVTDSYWKDLEPRGKKFMILRLGVGDYVRASGVNGGDLKTADVDGKFPILDGIDYKSNSETHSLLYMEV